MKSTENLFHLSNSVQNLYFPGPMMTLEWRDRGNLSGMKGWDRTVFLVSPFFV